MTKGLTKSNKGSIGSSDWGGDFSDEADALDVKASQVKKESDNKKLDVDEIFEGTPEEHQGQIKNFKKRNGKVLDANEDNYDRLARMAYKISKGDGGLGQSVEDDIKPVMRSGSFDQGDEAPEEDLGESKGGEDTSKEKSGDEKKEKRGAGFFKDAIRGAHSAGKSLWGWLSGDKEPEGGYGEWGDYKKELDEIEGLANSTGVGNYVRNPYVESMDRELALSIMSRPGSFFYNNDPSVDEYGVEQYNNDHVHELVKGKAEVYDFANKEYPNAYPKVEHEFMDYVKELGINAKTIIDVGQRIPETSDALHYYGRELLQSMAEFPKGALDNIRSIHFVTREQFEKGKDDPDSPCHDIYLEGVDTSDMPAFFNGATGGMVVFIDDFKKGKNLLDMHPPVQDLRQALHHALGFAEMDKAPKEFRNEWAKNSMFKPNEDGDYGVKDVENKDKILSTLKDVFKSDYLAKLAGAVEKGDGDYVMRAEMAEVARLARSDQLNEILQSVKQKDAEAYQYLTRMLALVKRYESNMPVSPVRPDAVGREMPEVEHVDPAALGAIRERRKKVLDAMAQGLSLDDLKGPEPGQESPASGEKKDEAVAAVEYKISQSLREMPINELGQVGKKGVREKAFRGVGIYTVWDLFENLMDGKEKVAEALIKPPHNLTVQSVVKGKLFRQMVGELLTVVSKAFDVSSQRLGELRDKIVEHYQNGTTHLIKTEWAKVVMLEKQAREAGKGDAAALSEAQAEIARLQKELDAARQPGGTSAPSGNVPSSPASSSPTSPSGPGASPPKPPKAPGGKPPKPPRPGTGAGAPPKDKTPESDEARQKRLEDEGLWD